MSTLLDTAAIAAKFGVTQKTVTDRWTKYDTFPQPIVKISRRLRWWSAEQVDQWAAGPGARQSPDRSRDSTSEATG